MYNDDIQSNLGQLVTVLSRLYIIQQQHSFQLALAMS